jgi:hypothetical protein
MATISANLSGLFRISWRASSSFFNNAPAGFVAAVVRTNLVRSLAISFTGPVAPQTFIAGKPWFAPESLCLFLVSILATVFVAWLSYEFCEVHFLKLKNLYKPKPVCYRDVATNLSQG